MYDYARFYGKGFESAPGIESVKSDLEVLQDNWKFIRSDEDNDDSTWEKRMAKKYYDKLYKEYCIADLSRYEEGKVWGPVLSFLFLFVHSPFFCICCPPRLRYCWVVIRSRCGGGWRRS